MQEPYISQPQQYSPYPAQQPLLQPPPRGLFSGNKTPLIILAVFIVVIIIILIIVFATSGKKGSDSSGSNNTSNNSPGSNGNVLENPYGPRTGTSPTDPLAGTGSGSGQPICPHPGMRLDDTGTCVCAGDFISDPEDPSQCICKPGFSLDPGDISRCMETGVGGEGSGPIAASPITNCPPYHILSQDKTECIPVGLSSGTVAQEEIPTLYGYRGMRYNGGSEEQVHLADSNQAPSLLSCMSKIHEAHKNVNYGPKWNIGHFVTANSPNDAGCKMYRAPNFVDIKTSCDQGSCIAQYPDFEYMITTTPLKDGANRFISPAQVIYPDGSTARYPNLNV